MIRQNLGPLNISIPPNSSSEQGVLRLYLFEFLLQRLLVSDPLVIGVSYIVSMRVISLIGVVNFFMKIFTARENFHENFHATGLPKVLSVTHRAQVRHFQVTLPDLRMTDIWMMDRRCGGRFCYCLPVVLRLKRQGLAKYLGESCCVARQFYRYLSIN